MYKIKTIQGISELDSGEKAPINIYNWGGDYQPNAYGVVCFIEDKGFVVKLDCEESDPLATVKPPFGHVCIDSCLEFFANFSPETANSPYINFESNCLGALCCEFSPKGGLRPKFVDHNIPLPTVDVYKTEANWGVIMQIDIALLRTIYGDIQFKKGDIIRGNFFKCGDHTKQPHFGSYTKIDTKMPSFHQPQFFADMQID